MSEIYNFTTPVSRTTAKLYSLEFNLEVPYITARFRANTNEDIVATWTGSVAMSLLSNINTFNFSAGTSFIKKVYQRAAQDGFIAAGSISGTPD
jgi:hypothetical protein